MTCELGYTFGVLPLIRRFTAQIRKSRFKALAFALAGAPLFGANASNYTYLALGDSIPFGFDPTITAPATEKYVGYPEIVADVLHLRKSKKLVNTACPGETSGSFLQLGAPDNGCLGPGPQGQPGFKYSVGLHTSYTESQAAFAIAELSTNKHINLVTLSIGGNDLLLVAQQCAAAPDFAVCVRPKLGPALEQYATNLVEILRAIRARYDGSLLLVNVYAPNADPLFIEAVTGLNTVMAQIGSGFGATVVDAFQAFQLASALYGGDPCQAGLLVRLDASSCDVHPSATGRDLLAGAVLLSTSKKK